MQGSTNQVDRLRKSAANRFDSSTPGVLILHSLFVLSGILSAIFFWRHSATVFAGLPAVAAVTLGLLIGIIPSEGAFFGWKRIRAKKQDMTEKQLKASEAGVWTGIGFAVTNVIAIFLTSFPNVPANFQEMAGWIAFFALMLPIPTQVLLYASFVVNEQSVIENHAKARLSALAHAAYIRGEEARIGAVLEGIDAALERGLLEYGATTGGSEAERILRDGQRDIVGQYYNRVPRVVSDAPPQLSADQVNALLAIIGNSTHTSQPAQEKPNGPPRPVIRGRGEDNRP